MIDLIIRFIDYVLFGYALLSVLYLLYFATASRLYRPVSCRKSDKQHRFLILFPAYKEDKVILSAVRSFLHQSYPKDLYEVVVISDRMEESTNHTLRTLPITLLTPHFEESSKAKAMQFAVNQLKGSYDAVVILDADNVVENSFLEQLNDYYSVGVKALQTHRMAKNRNTDIAVLDAVSEEINNSIFRLGHIQTGFSSALIGSGMMFDYEWFVAHVDKLQTAGEDKELEVLLLTERVHIHYANETPVYDEKTQKAGAIRQQRRRWMATQFFSLFAHLRHLPGALCKGNKDYADKIIQWCLPPRILLLALIGGCCGLTTLAQADMSLKWWGLLFLLCLVFYLAMPAHLRNAQTGKALLRIPQLALMMIINLFHLKGAGKKFIHTEHEHITAESKEEHV